MLLAHAVTLPRPARTSRPSPTTPAPSTRPSSTSTSSSSSTRSTAARYRRTTEVLTDKRDVLYTVAEAAIEELVDHGVDALQVELVLARLEDARALDRP